MTIEAKCRFRDNRGPAVENGALANEQIEQWTLAGVRL